MSGQVGLSPFVTPVAKTGKPLADEGERIEKANRPRSADRLSDQRDGGDVRHSPGLAARRASALILGWGALDEGENQASDGRCDGRGTLQKKFYWRPVAPTFSDRCLGSVGTGKRRKGFGVATPAEVRIPLFCSRPR